MMLVKEECFTDEQKHTHTKKQTANNTTAPITLKFAIVAEYKDDARSGLSFVLR